MIIFPQALVLSAAATPTPLTHARIGYHTYLRELAAADVTVSGETADGPRDAPLRPDTAEFWQGPATPAWWKVDMRTVQRVDYLGIAAHSIASSRCSVKVEYSTNNVDWSAFSSTSESAPADDSPLIFLTDSVDGIIARWIRLSFAGSTPPHVAVTYAGLVLPMERPIYGGHAPGPLSRDTELNAAMSRGGQFLGQGFRRHGISTQIAFSNLTAAWVRSKFDAFVKAARQYPYFLAWRPQTFPNEVVYAWRTGNIKPSNMGKRDLMQVSWPVNGHGTAA